jgi:hypothetical protein
MGMRALIMVPLCLLAACGGGEEKKKAEVPAAFPAGAWQVQGEVTAIRSTDKTTPVEKAAIGDKAGANVCLIGAEQQAAPPAALFAEEGYSCTYQNSYIRSGSINASMKCAKKGVSGDIMIGVQGSYTADSFEAKTDYLSYLPGTGDFAMSRKVSGKLAKGPCEVAPPPVKTGGGKKG